MFSSCVRLTDMSSSHSSRRHSEKHRKRRHSNSSDEEAWKCKRGSHKEKRKHKSDYDIAERDEPKKLLYNKNEAEEYSREQNGVVPTRSPGQQVHQSTDFTFKRFKYSLSKIFFREQDCFQRYMCILSYFIYVLKIYPKVAFCRARLL